MLWSFWNKKPSLLGNRSNLSGIDQSARSDKLQKMISFLFVTDSSPMRQIIVFKDDPLPQFFIRKRLVEEMDTTGPRL